MSTAIATRERLTSAAITLHHPLDHYFKLFLRAIETAGLKPGTLNDHKSYYRTVQVRFIGVVTDTTDAKMTIIED